MNKTEVQAGFEQIYGLAPVRAFFAPGRVNLIGEHLDYNGGVVLPVVVDRGIHAFVSDRTDGAIHLAAAGFENREVLQPEEIADLVFDPQRGWVNYVVGVLKVFLAEADFREAFPTGGLNVFFGGDLPVGAGLSSSAALEVVVARVFFNALFEKQIKNLNFRARVAYLCQRAENDFVGVACGVLDQMAVAILADEPNKALLLDTLTRRRKLIGFEPEAAGVELVVLHTGKSRELVSSAYNDRREECRKAWSILEFSFGIPALATGEEGMICRLQDPILVKRARHVISEQKRTLMAAEALQKNDFQSLGMLMNASHQSLKEDFEVTGPELDALVESLQAQSGCLGARMTGAGFGGCAIGLFARGTFNGQAVLEAYRTKTNLTGRIIVG